MPAQVWDAAGEFRVVAPSTKTTRALLIVLGTITAIGGVITLTTVSRGAATVATSRGPAYGLVMLLSGGVFFVFLLIWSANVRLLIGRGAVGYRDAFRRTHFWSRGEISHVVEMSIDYGWMTQTGQQALYLFGLDGRRLVVLSVVAWHANDLRDFVEATGLPLDRRLKPVPIKIASQEFPKAFSWGARHILAMGCLLSVAVVVMVIAAVVIFVR